MLLRKQQLLILRVIRNANTLWSTNATLLKSKTRVQVPLFALEGGLKVFFVNAMNARRRSRSTAPLILNLDTRWKCKLHAPAVLPPPPLPRETTSVPIQQEDEYSHGQCLMLWKKGNAIRAPDRPALNLVAIPSPLLRFANAELVTAIISLLAESRKCRNCDQPRVPSVAVSLTHSFTHSHTQITAVPSRLDSSISFFRGVMLCNYQKERQPQQHSSKKKIKFSPTSNSIGKE
jgi:hypothetical protein